MENHKIVYTPYLGIIELIANFEFIGDFKSIPDNVEGEIKEIDTVARVNAAKLIPGEGKKYGKEIITLLAH